MSSAKIINTNKTKSFFASECTYLRPHGTCLLYLSSVPIKHRYSIVLIKCSKMAAHTVPSWRQQERHHRWSPCPIFVTECICDGTCLLYLSSVIIKYSRLSFMCSKMAAHTFMTSARTAPPMKTMSFLRGGVYLRPYLPTVPFVWSIIPDCSEQTVFPRWWLIPSWRQQERHHQWRPCPSSAADPRCGS